MFYSLEFVARSWHPALDHPYSYARNNPTNFVDPSGELSSLFGRLGILDRLSLVRCLMKVKDESMPLHRGGGSIAHCTMFCRALTECPWPPGCVPFGQKLQAHAFMQVLGWLFELVLGDQFEWQDLAANDIGQICAELPGNSCEECCRALSAFRP
jgi:hypothetical protein